MKRLLAVFLVPAVLLLTGCAAKQTAVWETVDDVGQGQPVSYLDEAYTMLFDVPQGAALQSVPGDGEKAVYAQADGEYEIVSEVLLCADADEAIRRVSGFSPEQLAVIETSRFGMPEYQFVWYASGDEGGRLYRADVLVDDLYCYALTFSVREGLGSTYDTTAQQVFASYSLYYDEGV